MTRITEGSIPDDRVLFSEEEAASMKLRATLTLALRQWMEAEMLTPTMAADRLNITRPRANNLWNGHTQRFSKDALTIFCATASSQVNLSATLPPEREVAQAAAS